MAISLTTAVRNAMLDAVTTATGSAALLRIYDGTPPANANTALAGNTLLAELVCASPFAPGASSGVLTASAITQDSSANATGTASFFRVYASNGTTVIGQGTVSTSGADCNLNTVSLVSGGPVQVTSFVWTMGSP